MDGFPSTINQAKVNIVEIIFVLNFAICKIKEFAWYCVVFRCFSFLSVFLYSPQLLEKALSGYDAQKEAKDAKAAKEPSRVGKSRKSRLAPDPHPSPEVRRSASVGNVRFP